MSADNWAICPKCYAAEIQKREDAKREAAESYGKVAPERYLELLHLSNYEIDQENRTLREDYQIGIGEDGAFEVDYSGACGNCDFSFEYKYKQTL